jgi:hypothetical protein
MSGVIFESEPIFLINFDMMSALNYGGTKVTCVCFYLSRGHEILCRGHELLSHGNEIANSWPRDTMSWPRVSKSWERDS